MKKIKVYICIALALAVIATMFLNPQYTKDVAQALVIIMEENQCGCES